MMNGSRLRPIKGVEITDQATQEFLNELDALDKPVTVVFYGDHLPGIYSSASEDDNNSLALHLTDYFIWSNKASSSQAIRQAMQPTPRRTSSWRRPPIRMNAKVSPYLAFLTGNAFKIAAMEPPVVNKIQGWDRIPEGQNSYLDQNGNPMSTDDFDKGNQAVACRLQAHQYDITAGKNYYSKTRTL